MRKLIKINSLLVCLFALTALSCQEPQTKILNQYEAMEKVQFNDSTLLTEIGSIDEYGNPLKTKLLVMKYDGCEYIVVFAHTVRSEGGVSTSIIHTASCSNPIHLAQTKNE